MNPLFRTPIFALAVLGACAPEAELAPELSPGASELIYGTDDRQEWYEVSDPALRALGAATAVIVSPSWVTSYANGDVEVDTSYSLRDYQGVCTSEPYWNQPVPGDCTAFLVGDDLVATAGHCVSSSSCSTSIFVFGFRMESANTVRSRVSANDVYTCASVVSRQSTTTRDYAVVRLDRPVTGRSPMALRRSGTVSTGTPLLVTGHPVGLPLKFADNATVRGNSQSTYFEANLDVYGGSSGSPVINANTLEVEGILVRGNDDWDWAGNCYVSNVCADSGCPSWEEVTRTSLFEASVPVAGAGGGCTDDGFEPNDAQSAAATLVAGAYTGMEVCSGDDDWFAVTLAAGDTLTVATLFSHASGDLDLAVHNAAGTRLAVAESVSDNEGLVYQATGASTVYVRVYGYQGAENGYELQVDVSGANQAGVVLTGSATAQAGASYTWVGQGGAPNSDLVVVTGSAGGATAVPGCPAASVPASNLLVVGSMTTDGAGAGQLSRTLPSSLAGSTRQFWAVSRSTCEVSPALSVSIQ